MSERSYKEVARLPWRLLLINIRDACNMPWKTMARKAHMSETQLKNILDGNTAEPKFGQGMLLLDLHLEKCGPALHQQLITQTGEVDEVHSQTSRSGSLAHCGSPAG